MRWHMILVTAAAAIIGTSVALLAESAEQEGLGLVVSSEKAGYKVGEPVRVRFTWTNLGRAKLLIPNWRGPTGGVTLVGRGEKEIYDFSIYYEGTERLTYHGVFACGPIVGLLLDPGVTVTRVYEINDVYDVARPGRYVIRAAYFGYPRDDASPEHWRGEIVHPDVEVWVRE